MQNATVREYTVENIHIHKVIVPWDRGIFVRETEAIIRKAPLVRSPKQVIVPFSYSSIFLFSTFPAMQYQRFFSLFDTFSFLPRDRGNYKESAACLTIKASNSSHFHTPLMFLFFTFPAIQYQSFFLFLIPLLILEILIIRSAQSLLYHEDSNMLH